MRVGRRGEVTKPFGFWRATVQNPAQSDRAAVNTLYIRLYVRFTVVTSTGDERRHHAVQYKNKY